MKVTKVTTTKTETSASLDLFEGKKLPKDLADRIREDVGSFLVEQTLLATAASKSPVAGEGKFPALKRGPYRDKKGEELGNTSADLQYSGETLDEFTFQYTKDGIKVGVFGDRAPVIDGHSNLSGKSTLPRRRVLPAEGQKYAPAIEREVERIIADAITEESSFTKSDFDGVTNQRELIAVLKEKLGPMSRSELSLTVYRNGELVTLLRRLDLLRLVP